MMKTRASLSILALLAVGLAISFPGCGSGGLSPVSGSVIYQGKPATGASVHFHREGATAEEGATFPIGVVDADGNFQLETPGVGKGALPGRYNVLILWPIERPIEATSSASSTVRAKGGKSNDPKYDADRLNYRYFQAAKPLLTAEVKAEANKLEPFELKD